MEFTIEFYETRAGRSPVQEFLDELKASDPDDFAAVLAGLVKLKNSWRDIKMKRKTNFDRYLEAQLKDPDFTARFQKAGEAWDVALQMAALRKASGMSQKELAQRVGTTQQQISRLESPIYEGHSLSMLRRVAEALGARVFVKIEHRKDYSQEAVAESTATYGKKA